MAEDAHSLFSASGADGWSVCTGKPAMEEGRKTSSSFADEGTAAHTLASRVMADRIDGGTATARDFLGEKIHVKARDGGKGRTFTVSAEMAEHVDDYVDRFFLYASATYAELFCEQRVHYHTYLGVAEELAFGTGDGIALLFDQPELEWEGQTYPAGDELQLHDLKYGAGVQVDADTLQLKLYGAGALYEYGHLANVTRVRLVIHQPRKDHLDELVLTTAELLAVIAKLKPAVPKVWAAFAQAKILRLAGKSDLEVGHELHASGYLKPSDKGCRFCDAKAVCPAVIAEVGEAVSGKRISPEEFEDLTVDGAEEAREYGGNYLAAAYLRLDLIDGWMKAVRAEIDRRVLIKGERFDVCKVVPGKRGARQYADQGEAEAVVRRLPEPVRKLLYKQTLLTPTQAEKALKNCPDAWTKLQPLIVQSEGKPAVVPLSDRRAAMSHKALVHDFEDLTAEEQPAPRLGAPAGRDRHPFRD